MLRLSVLFVSFSFVFSNTIDSWPFTLADKYLEEFQSSVDELKHLATNYYAEQNTEGSALLKHLPKEIVSDNDHYDFIIIGGGTSGAILASRLSEVPEWKILLLEAGDIETTATKVPRNWEILRNTYYNWAFKTTPQNYTCLAMKDHKCTIPTGRAIGGTSAINSMLYTRGHPHDFDTWADNDNLGWCWDDVITYFKKIEDANFEPFDKKFHHLGGPQHLQHPEYLTDYISQHALEAAQELGYHSVDYNGKHQSGASIPQLTAECGRRYSTASAYLEKTAKRKNLVVRPLAQVLKILISPHTKEAKAVQYLHGGKVFETKAEKEIILAAGALNTPKILLLSGIGPKSECEKHKIDIICDLKVGHNLKIRPSFIGLDFIEKEPKHNESFKESRNDLKYTESLQYLKDGKGRLTSPGIETVLYLKSNISKYPMNYPDVELQLITKNGVKVNDFNWMHFSIPHYNSVWQPIEDKNILKIVVTLNHPKSTGVLKLHSTDPLENPIIEPHFLSDEEEIDYHTFLKGIHKAIELIHTESFKKLGLIINHHAVHGCEETEFGTDSYWECALKYLIVPTEDVSGTAKMGPKSDIEAVVDNKLKVYGIHKLRVADASVIPVSISGNLMATTMVIGEKAAHMIIDEWYEG